MPADPAGQGTQADTENASTPGQLAPDKQTTDRVKEQVGVKEQGSHAVSSHAANEAVEATSDPLMDQLGIPKDVQAQISRTEEPEQTEAKAGEADRVNRVNKDAAGEDAVEATKDAQDEADTDSEEEEDQAPAAEDKDDLDGKSPDELKKIVAGRQKRIKRLTRQKWRVEEQLDKVESEAKELREKLEQQAGSTAGPSGKMPELRSNEWFPDEETAQTHSTLSAERDKADAVIQWCNEHSDGATTVEGDKETFITPQQVAQWKSRAEGDRLRVSPEIAVIERETKQAYRATQARFDNLAQQAWPQLFDKGTKEYQLSRAILKQFPAVKLSPEANYAVGLVIEGMRAVQMRLKPNGNGAVAKPRHDISPRAFEPRVPIAPHTPEPPSREATPSSTKRYNEAMSNLKNDPDGSAASLAAVFAAEDEMSKTRAGSKTPVRV